MIGEHILSCKDCRKELVDVHVTTDADITFKYVALCPFCNSQSEESVVKGFVCIGSVVGTKLKDIRFTDKTVIVLEKE